MGQMKTLKRVLRYIRHYLGLVSLSIALAALTVVLTLYVPVPVSYTHLADHGGAAPHQGDGPVPRPLQMGHGHDGDIVADVQAVGGGVKAGVKGDGLPRGESLFQLVLVGDLGHKAPLPQDSQGALHLSSSSFMW